MGRPKKQPGEPVNHSKPLSQNPDRRFLMLKEALIRRGVRRGLSESHVGATLTGLRYGVPHPDDIAAKERDEPYRVWADPNQGQIPAIGGKNGAEHRDKSIFRAVSENENRKAREWRKAEPFDENAVYRRKDLRRMGYLPRRQDRSAERRRKSGKIGWRGSPFSRDNGAGPQEIRGSESGGLR